MFQRQKLLFGDFSGVLSGAWVLPFFFFSLLTLTTPGKRSIRSDSQVWVLLDLNFQQTHAEGMLFTCVCRCEIS